MGLASQHLNTQNCAFRFDPTQLALKLQEGVPEIEFCLLMGSAVNGTVGENSDIDLAVYLNEPSSLKLQMKIIEITYSVLPAVRWDIGILNRAEPVFRFEALKGKLLFFRNQEVYSGFFSLTCREYESQLFDYARQHAYRLEAAANAL